VTHKYAFNPPKVCFLQFYPSTDSRNTIVCHCTISFSFPQTPKNSRSPASDQHTTTTIQRCAPAVVSTGHSLALPPANRSSLSRPIARAATGHPPLHLAHGDGRWRSRHSTARGWLGSAASPLAGISTSAWPWRPSELLLPSPASARPNAGTHRRRCLEHELHERSTMAISRAPANAPLLSPTSAQLDTGKHGRCCLERELYECSSMAAGRAPAAISCLR
jgi:hypothetical protein